MSVSAVVARVWNHPANENARLAALGRWLQWQFHKRLLKRHLTFTYHGMTIAGCGDSHSMSAAYYFNGLPDWWEMRFMMDYLRPGDRFLDIGANVGLYSLLAASVVGECGHVDSFEPAEVPSKRLREAIALNQLADRITIHHFAASDQNGELDFGFSDDDCQSHVRRPGAVTGPSVSVKAIRLDDYCGHNMYAMAKLDIEGHEPLALEGASKMMAAGNPPVMQIEMAGYSKLFGVPTSEFIQRLADRGYGCFCYEPSSRKLTDASRPW